MKCKRLISFVLILMLLGTITASAQTLTVAMELAYPPFETKDTNGDPTGVSVDLAYAIGEALGMEVVIVNTAWDGLIPSLQTGKADMVISSMTITEERSAVVDFSAPYASAQLAILANVDAGITSVEDLNDATKTIAVKTGSTGFLYAQKELSSAQILSLADESACVMEVAQGKADAFLYDQLTIYRNQTLHPDTTVALFIPFQDVESWGIAVQKGNSELLTQINDFLATYDFADITEKYLSEEKKAFDELGFQWFFDVNQDE